MTDYIGFTFGLVHSKDLGLLRVSDGSRYHRETSSPTKETVLNMEGSDVSYFIESRLEPRVFNVRIAYDNLDEEKVARIAKEFEGKEVKPLIFDELPYKAYFARVRRAPELTFVPFGNKYGERVYKGEGTIEFIAYDPFAVGTGKYLMDFPTEFFPNRDEWSAASRMKMFAGDYDGVGTEVLVFNAGDVPTDTQVYYSMSEVLGNEVLLEVDGDEDRRVLFKVTATENPADLYLRINSRTQLLEGCDLNKRPTGTLYNKYVIAGRAFDIERGESKIVTTKPCDEVRYYHKYY